MERIHVFIDTNIYVLHYPPLDQLDWCELCGSEEVVLVICLPVVQELDKKKSEPRLGDRAARAIQAIRQFAGSTPLRENVTLTIFNHEIRKEDFPATLSPDSMDDKIVYLAKKYGDLHPGTSVAVVTEDLE